MVAWTDANTIVWMETMTCMQIRLAAVLIILAGSAFAQDRPAVSTAPSAEVAKRCLHYAYILYPYKRPGAVRMSGDRQAYFKNCLVKKGEVAEPAGPAPPRP